MTEPLLPVTVRVNARLQEGQLADSIAGLFADLLARVSPGSHLVSTRLETGPHGEPRAAVAELAIAHALQASALRPSLSSATPMYIRLCGARGPLGRSL